MTFINLLILHLMLSHSSSLARCFELCIHGHRIHQPIQSDQCSGVSLEFLFIYSLRWRWSQADREYSKRVSHFFSSSSSTGDCSGSSKERESLFGDIHRMQRRPHALAPKCFSFCLSLVDSFQFRRLSELSQNNSMYWLSFSVLLPRAEEDPPLHNIDLGNYLLHWRRRRPLSPCWPAFLHDYPESGALFLLLLSVSSTARPSVRPRREHPRRSHCCGEFLRIGDPNDGDWFFGKLTRINLSISRDSLGFVGGETQKTTTLFLCSYSSWLHDIEGPIKVIIIAHC